MGARDTIQGVGQRTDRLVLRRDLDLTGLSLTPEEGFVLSRAEGCGSLGELVAVAGLPEGEVARILASLKSKGLIRTEAGAAPPGSGEGASSAGGGARKAPRAPTGAVAKAAAAAAAADRARPVPPPGAPGRYEGFIFNPADLAEQVDLPEDLRKELLFIDANLDRWTHYDVLSVRPAAPREDVRKRWLELSRTFHPDRYYGKELGSYKARLTRVFQAIKQAHEVLSDPEKKTAYDRVTEVPLTDEEMAALAAEQEARRKDSARAEERRDRLRRRNPLLKQRAKVQSYLDEAAEAESREDWRKAANFYRLALGHGPGDATIEAKLAAVDEKAAVVRADDLVQRAEQAEVVGHVDQALAMLEDALEAAPRHLAANLMRTTLLTSMGAAQDEILESAREAVASDRRSTKAWLLYGRALLKTGDKKEAKAAFTKALELNPKSEEAQESLKKLRWSLF